MIAGRRPRNDPAQYDELADQWWRARRRIRGAALAGRLPRRAHPAGAAPGRRARRPGVRRGSDGPARRPRWATGTSASTSACAGCEIAREHGVTPVRGSVLAVPLADGCADVVVAGEILEHVADDVGVLAECARLLRPGGTLVHRRHRGRPAVGADRRATCSSASRRAAAGHARPGAVRRPPPAAGGRRPARAGPRAGGPAALGAATWSPGGWAAGRRSRMKPIRSTAVALRRLRRANGDGGGRTDRRRYRRR